MCSRGHPNLLTQSNIKLLLEDVHVVASFGHCDASTSDHPVAKDTDHTYSQNDHAPDCELVVADIDNDSLEEEEEGRGLQVSHWLLTQC